jgi:hypothetical protein
MEGFEYVAEMKDGMSKPAKEGKAALHQLGEEIKKTEAEIRKLQGLQLSYRERGGNWKGIAGNVGNEVSKLRLHLGDLKKEEKETKEKSEGLFGSLMKGLIPEIALGEMAAKAGEKIAELGVEMVKFAVEAAEFKENTTSAYDVLGKNGEEMFASVDKLARQIHMPAEVAHNLTQDLLIRGLEDEQALADTVRAIGAAKRAGPAGTAERLQTIIDRSLSLGKFQMRSPRELASAGIDVEKLYADLGRRLGKGRDEIKAEMKAGAIDAKVGIEAIDDAINNGKIGEIAKKKLTAGDLLVDFKNNMRALFQDVDTKPLIDGFRDLVDVFAMGTSSGKSMHDTITYGINEVIKGLKLGIDTVIDFALEVEIGALKAYIGLFPLIDVIAKIVKGMDKLVDASDVLTGGGGGDAKGIFGEWSMADAAGPAEDAAASGKAMAAGLAAGIAGGKDDVVGASRDISMASIAAINDVYDNRSPSKEMMKVGKNVDEGFAVGVESGRSPDVMLDHMSAPDYSPSGVSSGGGGGTVVHVDVGGITIHALNGDEIMPLVESQIVDVFERAALEMGQ